MLSVNEMVRLNANMSHQMIATDMGKMLSQMAENGESGEGGEADVEDES